MVLFGQRSSIRAKVVVFGQNDCVGEKWLHSRRNGYIRAKLL